MNYRTLPHGCRPAGAMDFLRNRAQMIAVLKLALALWVASAAAGIIAHPPRPSWWGFIEGWYLWLAMLAMWTAYIPLHELTHGLSMYALSGVKPSYGLRLPYAWAGSTVWFDRTSHIVTALAPIVVWGVVIQMLIALLPEKWFWPLWVVQISNLSGSAGDIYCVWYLLRMEGELLIQDTGTRMRIVRLPDNHG